MKYFNFYNLNLYNLNLNAPRETSLKEQLRETLDRQRFIIDTSGVNGPLTRPLPSATPDPLHISLAWYTTAA